MYKLMTAKLTTAALLTGLALALGGCGDQSRPTGAATAGEQMDHSTMPGMHPAAAPCAALLSQGRPASASSSENAGLVPRAAFDGEPGTRWASQWSDAQWLQVDLGSVQPICGVTLQWEAASGKAYDLLVSNDARQWTPISSVTGGTGGSVQLTPAAGAAGRYVRMNGLRRTTGYGYSLFEMQVFGPGSGGADPGTGPGWIMADPPVTGVVPSSAKPPPRYFHEFQANYAVSRSNLPDDPIVSPGQPGASHLHTFMGNRGTNAASTLASLQAGSSSCSAPDDRSAYWMPSMLSGDAPVQPVGPQVIYYKTGVQDYTSVRPFPPGLRYVVGDMHATPKEFLAASVEGWECGNSAHNATFPACPAGAQLNVRFQAPSCWDGLHLDAPDHKRHMAYPVNDRCPASHPVAVPMIEFKMAFPAGRDTSKVRLSSGPAYSFHYDFFNAWDPATLQALVAKCINRGFQCNARGFDETHPEDPAVLGTDYRLP